MADPDASLGITASADTTAIRNALRFAMQLGAPPTLSQQATFIFPSTGRRYYLDNVEVFTPRVDRDGVPLNPEIKVVENQAVERKVDCAVEIEHIKPNELPVGPYRPTKATVTVLDEQYGLINGCREMRYSGDTYLFDSQNGMGLFDMGVFVMYFYGADES